MRVMKLLEEFSPSMPKWLKNFIMYTNNTYGKSISKTADPAYSNLRDNKYRDVGRGDNSYLASQLLRNGRGTNGKLIDFSRAKFIEKPVPVKIDDPILSDADKVCFVYLKSDNDSTVWMPGRSEPAEKFTLNADDKGNRRTIALKYLNNKLLKEYGQGFCYLDLNDPDNFINELKANRETSKEGSIDRERDPEAYMKRRHYYQPEVDRSGYVKIPITKKYENQLRELKIKKMPERLASVRSSLVKLQKNINDCRYNLLMSDEELGNDPIYDINNALSKETQAVKYLKYALKELDRFNNYEANDSNEWRRQAIIRDLDGTLTSAEKSIEDAQNFIKPYMMSSIDYDSNDDSIYTDIDISDIE